MIDIEDALFDDKYWITKDGAILKIEDMDKNHLENTMKYLERNNFKVKCKEKRYHSNDDMTFEIINFSLDAKNKYNNMKKALDNKC